MQDQQALNIGCNLQNLTQGWASRDTLNNSRDVSLYFLKDKRRELGNFFCSFFVEDYIKQPCIPEIFAYNFCLLNNKQDLLPDISLLGAFQTYAVSLYDLIEDKHFTRHGEKTLLGKIGIKKTIYLRKLCESIFLKKAKKLEKKKKNNALKLSLEQYLLTLAADSLRNKKEILPPPQALTLQDLLAGMPTEKIALLCGGNIELCQLAKSLGNSLSTLDDLIDLLLLEDVNKKKTTIPLSYLNYFNIKGKSKEEIRDNFINSDAFLTTLDYIYLNLFKSRNILKK
ncbi:MAG: hypothetical protein QW273_03375, partial [Candidatus Pacearchaeota archaeon]